MVRTSFRKALVGVDQRALPFPSNSSLFELLLVKQASSRCLTKYEFAGLLPICLQQHPVLERTKATSVSAGDDKGAFKHRSRVFRQGITRDISEEKHKRQSNQSNSKDEWGFSKKDVNPGKDQHVGKNR
jgi:hypothetical protein